MAIASSPDLPSDLFPIRELVRRTGVNASTLRAWENRHGLLSPTRTPSGHRLYNQQDVLRIRRVQDLLARGLGLGRRMMEQVMDRLRERGSPGAHLGVSVLNTSVLGFYLKLGFHELARVGTETDGCIYLGREL